MYEKEIIEIVRNHPGCTHRAFRMHLILELDRLIKRGSIIRQYCGMVPHYYLPSDYHRLEELELGYETQ